MYLADGYKRSHAALWVTLAEVIYGLPMSASAMV